MKTISMITLVLTISQLGACYSSERKSNHNSPSQYWLDTNPRDSDGDGVYDDDDNCMCYWNRGQEDDDWDGIGNSCDICPDDPTQECKEHYKLPPGDHCAPYRE